MNNKIGVITRGKIKLSKQLEFWLNVSSASDSIKNADGVEFYKGIGELPLLSQATFSVWNIHKAISDFAFKNKDLILSIVYTFIPISQSTAA